MPIRILSDLHLGHSGCVVEAVTQLRPLLEGAGSLVFNGDTMEELAPRYRDRSFEMFEELRELCRQLGIDARFVTGNHDPDVSSDHYVDLGEGILVTHGDTLFPLVSPWSRKIKDSEPLIRSIRREYSDTDLESLDCRLEMTRRSAAAMERSDPEFRRSLGARIKLLATELWPPRRPAAIAHSWLIAPGEAIELLECYRPSAKVVVFGHTHFPGVWRKRGKVAVNTGGFLGVLNARLVEVSERGISVAKVMRRGGEFRCGGRATLVSRLF